MLRVQRDVQRFEQSFSPVFCTNSPSPHLPPLMSPYTFPSITAFGLIIYSGSFFPCNGHHVLKLLLELVPIASGFPGLELLLGSHFH